jgi:hypothetical protein
MFIGLNASAAFRQVELSGEDAQYVMDAFKGIGRTSAHTHPLTGSILGLTFAFEGEGVSIECKVSNPGIVSRGSCKIGVNPDKQGQRVRIEQKERETVVTFADEESVRKIEDSLPLNPFTSTARASDGTSLVQLECKKDPDHVCRLRLAN